MVTRRSSDGEPRSYPDLVGLARRRLRELGVRPPLDTDELRTALARERGTTISVVGTDELPPGSAFAVTGRLGDREVVLHEARTTPSHQQLILLHEYAHMLLRHPPSSALHTQAEVEGFQEIDASVVAGVLGVPDDTPSGTPPASPTFYARAAEQDAETLATILLGWVPGHSGHVPARPRGRLDALLGDGGAW